MVCIHVCVAYRGVTVLSLKKTLLSNYHDLNFKILHQGLVCTQLGPSLLDLQLLTNSTVEQASYFVTAATIGGICGCVGAGLFKRLNVMKTDKLPLVCNNEMFGFY